MTLLKPLNDGTGYLKATLQGFPKSGKSYTAALLAIGTRELMGLDGPIAYQDTEGASGYLNPMVKRETGLDLVGLRSRSVDDTIAFIKECEEAGVSVAVIDSVTHLWKNLCDSWLATLNRQRKAKRQGKLKRLPMSAWVGVKGRWGQFMDAFLMSKLNIILCGRVSYDYDFGENDEGAQEIRKTGVKISAEKDTGYESSLLVEMERVEKRAEGSFSAKSITHRATVLGDRFGVIDAAHCENPTFDFFRPHVALLRPESHASVDMERVPAQDVDENGDNDWRRERKNREIICEELKHELLRQWPSTSVKDKTAKGDALTRLFQTPSWTAIQDMDSERIRFGLEQLKKDAQEAKNDD